jgi:hypothetical protein
MQGWLPHDAPLTPDWYTTLMDLQRPQVASSPGCRTAKRAGRITQ